MKAKTLFALLCALTIFSCNKEELRETQNHQLLTKSQLNALMQQTLDDGFLIHWEKFETEVVWSAGMQSDSLFAIGYTLDGLDDISKIIHTIDPTSSKWADKRSEILGFVLDNEKEHTGNPKLEIGDLTPFGFDQILPRVVVQITNAQTIEQLSKDPTIRYIEPLGYHHEIAAEKSSSGCSGDPNYNINSNDYTTVAPTSDVPWNFYDHNIDDAWQHSTGDNITLCIIDTGASDNQDNLGSQFDTGYSTNRFIEKYSTHYSGRWWWRELDSPHDPCGHGTSMAGLAAAPRTTDGNALGGAYESNLITVRAVQDVVISNSNEREGVKDALILAGNRSDVKVISMSIGSVFSSGTVSDGIYYAYNRGKMIFAAAGTSTSWTNWWGVIFPANMPQTVAVTGVKDGSSMQRCNTCHSGNEVDFVLIMQRANNNGRTSVGLATYSNQPKYIGGSSAATATTASIASMVWATNPGMNRSQVLQRLKEASQYYPSRHSQFGWGKIDALEAVTNN